MMDENTPPQDPPPGPPPGPPNPPLGPPPGWEPPLQPPAPPGVNPTRTVGGSYPASLSIDYPERELNRWSTAFRLVLMVPIFIIYAAFAGISLTIAFRSGSEFTLASSGYLVLPPLLMILFRKKYPRWWFDFNCELLRFATRINAYALLMTDVYPSTDERQAVRLELQYPDAERELARGMPLVKWLLALPHWIALMFVGIGVAFAVVYAWFAILFTGRYPRDVFYLVEGLLRWQMRVYAYAVLLITDEYPPFRLSA